MICELGNTEKEVSELYCTVRALSFYRLQGRKTKKPYLISWNRKTLFGG